MIFDRVAGITGGRNLDDHYYGNSTDYDYRDREKADVINAWPLKKLKAFFAGKR